MKNSKYKYDELKKYMNCVCWYDKIRVLILCVLYCGFDCDVMNVDVIDSVILRNK